MSSEVLQNVHKPQACRNEWTGVAEQKLARSSLVNELPFWKNEIGKFLTTAAQKAGLHREGKWVTNHSVRKTCISRLLDADIPENVVAQLSGH